jgi:TonB family protein
MTATLANLNAAEQAGADAAAVSELRDQADYRQRLIDAESGKFERLYAVSDLMAVRQEPPSYPRTAPRGASGSVEMQMTVTTQGDVRDIEVLGDPRESFERSAMQAVRGWLFEPVIEDGRPVPVRVAVKVSFEG